MPHQSPRPQPSAIHHHPRRGVPLLSVYQSDQILRLDLIQSSRAYIPNPRPLMVLINELHHISFRKDYTYAKQAPTFVSTGVGGVDEIARWILDHNGILYKDEPHMPYISIEVINTLTAQPGFDNSPALVMTDTLLYGADSIVQYYESRCAPHLRLIPKDST